MDDLWDYYQCLAVYPYPEPAEMYLRVVPPKPRHSFLSAGAE